MATLILEFILLIEALVIALLFGVSHCLQISTLTNITQIPKRTIVKHKI